jgi:ornithine carbamoyltransferase
MRIMLATASPEPLLQGRNFLTVADLSADEIGRVLRLAGHLRGGRVADQLPLLRGKTLGMLFEKPSLRTRASFEVGMTQLGGHAMIAQGSDFMVGSRETPEDASRVLSRYVDAIVVRTHAHEPLERFAAAATVPVINGLSAAAHPCQALADMLTIKDRFDTLAGLRLAYIGDARNNVAASLAEAAVIMGISVNFGSPPTHRPSEAFLARLQALGKPTGATARAFSSAIRAVRDVDVVYTDVWTSMGEEHLAERNAAALLPYRVDASMMEAAAKHAVFMHCLPAHREEEVAAEVIDGPQSVVFDQAENRLHAQKGLLVALMTDLRGMPE